MMKFVRKSSTGANCTTCTESKETEDLSAKFAFCRDSKRGFTVLELMVGIVIFTLGFLGAYLLIESANSVSIKSRDEIIGANIMRGQIELMKNMRDTNWIQFRSWDSVESAKLPTETENLLQPNTFYTVRNHFTAEKPLRIQKLSGFSLSQEAIMQEFAKNNSPIRLCVDSLGRYVSDCTEGNRKTNYTSFVQVEPLITKNTITNTVIPVERGYKLTVFFASFNK